MAKRAPPGAPLAAHPDVQLDVLLTERYVNLVDEGYDIAIRGGKLDDSTLVARKLTDTRWVLVASPVYVKKRGKPDSADALREHDCLVYGATGANHAWRVRAAGGMRSFRVGGRLASNNLDVLRAACVRGIGIAMLPEMARNRGSASSRAASR